MTWVLAILIRPFAAFFLLACVLLPIRFAVKAWFPEGMIKRVLLLHLWNDPGSANTGKQGAQNRA